MPYPWKILAELPRIGHSKSSTLNPLQWSLLILLGGTGWLIRSGAAPWLVIAAGLCSVANFLLMAYGYIFFMHTNPDALRSESYSLSKMALEKGLIGDSLQGLHDPRTIDAVVPSKNAQPQEQEQSE